MLHACNNSRHYADYQWWHVRQQCQEFSTSGHLQKKSLDFNEKKKSMCDEWFKIIVTEKGRLPIETILMTLQITCQLRR